MHTNGTKTIGKVFFVGAGPGHPDLLTLRAWACLRDADVIVHDALVPQELLNAVTKTVERVPVPRDAFNQHSPGENAGHLLVRLAMSGRSVVRLKGGDPSVFARLAEELQPLRDAGIDIEIIPGVTAALAAAAAAGVPLTSRSAASSVTILTGHESGEKLESVDFCSLAHLPGTLAIYMGVEQADKWSKALLAAGKPASTPITIVSRCSWPDQQIAVSSLGQCAADFELYRWPPPAVIIVGEVAQLPHEPVQIDSLPTVRPLAGRCVLITRPAGQGEDLASRVHARGGECFHLPTIRIAPPPSWTEIDAAIRSAARFDWIVFASTNSVHTFVTRLRSAGLDARALGTARIAAIGPSTRQALEQAGLACDLMPEDYRSEGLAEALDLTVRNGRFLLLQTDRSREVLRRKLEAEGHSVSTVIAYTSQTVEMIDSLTLKAIDAMRVDWITLTSSFIARSAAGLLAERMHTWRIASMSSSISAVLTQAGLPPTVEAAHATAESLVEAMAQWELAHPE